MQFAHDTEVALTGSAALLNTAPTGADPDREELATRAQLDAFARGWGWTGSRTRDRSELDDVRALRPRLRAIWTADVDTAVDLVNGLLREMQALPQLVKHDDWDYHLHAMSSEAPLAHRMAVESAMAIVDVIRMGETDRLAVCAASDCEDVLVDLSRNGSRRFCSTACSNRTNVAAFRTRHGRSQTS